MECTIWSSSAQAPLTSRSRAHLHSEDFCGRIFYRSRPQIGTPSEAEDESASQPTARLPLLAHNWLDSIISYSSFPLVRKFSLISRTIKCSPTSSNIFSTRGKNCLADLTWPVIHLTDLHPETSILESFYRKHYAFNSHRSSSKWLSVLTEILCALKSSFCGG